MPADAIDYLQYHGTSTELNDRIETRAVKLAFGDHARRLPGSSVKSVLGIHKARAEQRVWLRRFWR